MQFKAALEKQTRQLNPGRAPFFFSFAPPQ